MPSEEKTKRVFGYFVFVLILMTPRIFAGTTYYVDSTQGSDNNSGAESLPWKTIQKAAHSLVAGDTVVVRAGTYNERIHIDTSGSAGHLITYKAGSVNNVTVNGGFTIRGNYIKIDGFRVTGASTCQWTDTDYNIFMTSGYVEVANCFIYGGKNAGLRAGEDSYNCFIHDNVCAQNGLCGMAILGSYHVVQNNEIYDSRCSPCHGDADGIKFWGTGHLFKGNYIHDITYANNPGFSPHIDAFQTNLDTNPAYTTNITFDGNLIDLGEQWKSRDAFAKGWESKNLRNSTIKNNIVIAHVGFTAWEGSNAQNLIIVNNTFIGSLAQAGRVGIDSFPTAIWLDNCPNSTVKNNITVNWPDKHILIKGSSSTGLSIGYNCTYNSDGSKPGGTAQPHDLWKVNPLFVDVANGDHHLQTNSPCIDSGVTLSSVTSDFEGNPRPVGLGYDIGAYEYEGSLPQRPVARFAASPLQGELPLQVSFNASQSYDPDGTISSYAWLFGDGGAGSGMMTTHTYQSYGTFSAKLTVADNDNKTASTSKSIKIFSPPKAAFIYTPSPGRLPIVVNFDASTASDPDGQIVSYAWNFGQGGNATGKKVSHSFAQEGTYTTTLTVKDDIGLTAAASKSIMIAATPIVQISGGPTRGRAPLKAAFDGSYSKPSQKGGQITSLAWAFGDGSTAAGKKVTHTYTKVGNFSVTLTVTDNLQRKQSKTLGILVFSKPKAVFSYSPSIVSISTPVAFDASSSFDRFENIASYSWSFGDGTKGAGRNVTHRYSKGARRYTVTLTVTNVQGYKNSVSKSIFVKNQ